MKVEIKKLPKSEVELTITVPYDVYQKWEKKALEGMGKEIKIEGFRSGHIPEDIVRQNVTDDDVKGSTLDLLLTQTYTEAVKENNLQVIAQPKVDIKTDIKKEGDDFVYVAIVAVMPEVEVGNYKKIKVAKKPVKVEKKNIDETIQMVMQRFSEWKDIDGKAKKDNRAEVNFEGFDEEGKSIPNTVSKNHPIVLGSNTMVPGFEDAIIGMSKDETKEFEVDFPKDYHSKPMQGKKVKFKITLNRLEEKIEQKLDDVMVEKITGQKKSVDEFTKLVEEDLKAEMERKNQAEHDNAVVAEIIKITKVEVPTALAEQELEGMMQEQKQRVAQQGLEWSKYLEHIKKTEEDFKKDHLKDAEQRVIAKMGVQHIIKDANISASEEDADAKVKELTANYPADQKEKVLEHYKKDGNAYRTLKHNLAADKLINMLTK